MKILLLHNHYGSAAPSGENQVFEAERVLLEGRGHDVRTITRHSDSLRETGSYGAMLGALSTPWNVFAANAVREEVQRFKPDVVHAHNTFPLLSPAVFPAANGAARVLSLHNYRLFCAAAIPLRDGHTCTLCLDRHSVTPALLHGCYRGSRIATFPIAAGIALHRARGTWRRDVEAFIALTEDQRNRLVAAGLPSARTYVKPNFYPGTPTCRPWHERSGSVVYAGRLSGEKGVDVLVRAWSRWGAKAPELLIIGDGPLRARLEDEVRQNSARIRFLGQCSAEETQYLIGDAKLVLVPSTCIEGFPMVLRECFALGTPTLVSDLGPLPALVRDAGGTTFRASDDEELRRRASDLWEQPDRLAAMSMEAHAAFQMHYTESANHDRLMHIYEAAQREYRDRGTAQ
ncbi:MAG: glycosyltransferase family 4 protein [Xanthomonadales bacterium]|nr:glycosyltransferase family 4 protein [Xanthomonadales bacterium]